MNGAPQGDTFTPYTGPVSAQGDSHHHFPSEPLAELLSGRLGGRHEELMNARAGEEYAGRTLEARTLWD